MTEDTIASSGASLAKPVVRVLMQTFGSRKCFAIEAEVLHFYEETKAVGYIQLWIDSKPIGDRECAAPLSIPLANFRDILETESSEHVSTLIHETKESLIPKVISAAYTESDRYSNDEFDPDQKFRDLILCPHLGEAFDNDLVLILWNGDFIRLVWTDHFGDELEYDQIFERRINKDEFLDPIRQFVHWLEQPKVTH